MSKLKCFKKVGDNFVETNLLDLKKGDLFETYTKEMGSHSEGGVLTFVDFNSSRVLWEATSDPSFDKEKGWWIDSKMIE